MFFSLSKVFWFFADPGNLLLLLLAMSVALLWTRWLRVGRYLALFCLIAGFLITVLPLGTAMSTNLENRFPPVTIMPDRVDGIIVLGGVVDQFVSSMRGQTAANGAVERLIAFADLAKRYPDAKLVFSGGSGVLGRQKLKEAHYVSPLLASFGLNPARVQFEDQSRNTAENAAFTKRLIKPRPKEVWVLITSAFHITRSVGAFRKQNWNIIPYPVDYNTVGDSEAVAGLLSTFQLSARLGSLRRGLHEYIGLFAYWLTDRSDEIYPAPRPHDGR